MRLVFFAIFSFSLILDLVIPGIAASQTPPAGRDTTLSATDSASEQDLNNQIEKLRNELSGVVTPDLISDRSVTGAMRSDLVKKLKTLITLNNELQKKTGGDASQVSLEQLLAAFLGDSEAQADLERLAQNSDPKVALAGHSAVLTIQFWKNSADADAQNTILDRMQSLAESNPGDPHVAAALKAMYQVGGATRAVRDRAAVILMDKTTGSQSLAMKLEFEGRKTLRRLEGQPMPIKGAKIDGTDFSTDRWKGKVILVDFWATWCGPCVARLPRIERAYTAYHAKGLEVLGISNDFDLSALRVFLTGHEGVQWPQLFDADAAKQQQLHPVTRSYGIGTIPQVFLIDKKGVCREVDSGNNLETEIEKLLAE